MAKKTHWLDDYWLLLMQIFLKKPVGMKAAYSRDMVTLALELHIHPQLLEQKMQQIASLDTPRIERIWNTYSGNPRKLARAARLLREMKGFGKAEQFYEGVEIAETWERDWQPIGEDSRMTPVMLILILDLYFRLTPPTMVKETPEVQELAKEMGTTAAGVVEVLEVFQYCDPYLNRRDMIFNSLLLPCQEIWHRYGNDDTEKLATTAEQLKAYFR